MPTALFLRREDSPVAQGIKRTLHNKLRPVIAKVLNEQRLPDEGELPKEEVNVFTVQFDRDSETGFAVMLRLLLFEAYYSDTDRLLVSERLKGEIDQLLAVDLRSYLCVQVELIDAAWSGA